MTSNLLYGRTPIGQLIYDLGFAKLTDKWLARKHKMPIAEIRKLREKAEAHVEAKRHRFGKKRRGVVLLGARLVAIQGTV